MDIEISVIIPVYNVDLYLEECLDSVLCQDFSSFEVICVEDCSDDNSLGIAKKYKDKYGNFFLLKNDKNMGLSYSRNRGLEYARGKYIFFVDSDDFLEKDALKLLYNKAEKDCLEILYFNKRIIYEKNWKGKRENTKEIAFGNDGVFTGKELFVQFLKKDCLKSMNAYTQFFLRDFLLENKLKFYDGIIHEDFLFFFQCAMEAKKVGNIDRALYTYRKRNNSITGKITTLHKQSMFITLMEVLDYWRRNEFTKEEDVEIRRFCEGRYQDCINYFKKINSNDRLELGKAADAFLYGKYNEIMNQEIYFTDEDLDKIRKSDDIWIYGAGKVARETIIYLTGKGFNLQGCFVTKTDHKQKLFGWEVWQLDDVPISRSTLIVLAAAQPHKTEMIKKLKQKKHDNVIYAVKKIYW